MNAEGYWVSPDLPVDLRRGMSSKLLRGAGCIGEIPLLEALVFQAFQCAKRPILYDRRNNLKLGLTSRPLGTGRLQKAQTAHCAVA